MFHEVVHTQKRVQPTLFMSSANLRVVTKDLALNIRASQHWHIFLFKHPN